MQATTLPLYDKVHGALADPEFMPDGGLLGIHCTHAYAHSTRSGGSALPAVLKGADMAVYAVFRAHGLTVQVRPIVQRLPAGRFAEVKGSDSKHKTLVGVNLGGLTVTEVGGDERDSWGEIWSEWAHDKLAVHWLTRTGPRELEEPTFIHLTYGNEPGLDVVYTAAALLVQVPPASERSQCKESVGVELTKEDGLSDTISRAPSTQPRPASTPAGQSAE